jgi:hypothetical protein
MLTEEQKSAIIGAELGKIAGGMIDAMSIVCIAVITTTKVSRKAFCDPLDAAAEALKAEGNAYAEKILRGVVRRIRG